MVNWNWEESDRFGTTFKRYEKKHPNELKALLANLDKYLCALQQCGNPLQIKAGFIHNEPQGIKALDQSGGAQRHKLKEVRLYIFPSIENKVLHLLIIGDKTSQQEDINFSKDYLKKLKRG